MRLALSLLALAGCSKIIGIDDLHGPGSGSNADASSDGARMDAALPDVPVAAMVKIKGQVTTINPTTLQDEPVPNMPVELHHLDGSVAANGSTDSTGQFSFALPTGGMPFQGYVYAAGKTINAEDAYYYLRPVTADTTATNFVLFTQQGIAQLAQYCNAGNPNPQNAFAFAFVTTADGAGKAGITLQSSVFLGNEVRYFNAQGTLPDSSLSSTSPSGIAVMFNVVPGATTFIANQSGAQVGQYNLDAKPMTTYFVPLVVP